MQLFWAEGFTDISLHVCYDMQYIITVFLSLTSFFLKKFTVRSIFLKYDGIFSN